MRYAFLAAGLWSALASPASARTLTCQSALLCDGSTTCVPYDSTLHIEVPGDGTATFAWDDGPTIVGTVRLDEPTLIIDETEANGTGSMLVIGEQGTGSFFTATDFGNYLVSHFYTLTCSAQS